jgi:hypothetical protein
MIEDGVKPLGRDGMKERERGFVLLKRGANSVRGGRVGIRGFPDFRWPLCRFHMPGTRISRLPDQMRAADSQGIAIGKLLDCDAMGL